MKRAHEMDAQTIAVLEKAFFEAFRENDKSKTWIAVNMSSRGREIVYKDLDIAFALRVCT